MSARRRVGLAAAWGMAALIIPTAAWGAPLPSSGRDGAGSHGHRPRRAASGPADQPLLAPATPGTPDAEEAAAGREREDPLVSNGLGSPGCGSPLSSDLAPVNRRDCETSGFTAAGAPTGNFGLDVHIDTGLIPLSGASLLSTVQNLFVTPVWLALVWLVHVLVVMLEWSFGLNLIEGSSSRALQALLSSEGRVLTAPLLVLALSVAAVLVAYHGLLRRRIGQTLGETLAMLAMIAGGTWLMVDPAGTVGALSSWSGEAGLGTLAAAARGTPSSPGRALAQGMNTVFAATIEAPWCFLEFGNVAWCRDPTRQERDLRAAGLQLADREAREQRCAGAGSDCNPADVGKAASVRLLREAHTNGDEFLAFPPNGPERNSINDGRSLLRAICRSSDATACSGPGASEAEFRTNSGTWPRVTGLLLIVIGLLGMLLLLGYIALRLLLAAILSVFYLLLTPGLVLLPAFGEAGRGLFRAWASRLFGAVVAKLVFAFLLGAVLAVMAALDALEGLGWWADWMLLTAFWWGAFLKRRDIVATANRGRPGSVTAKVTQAGRIHREFVERRDARERRNDEQEERRRRRHERKRLSGAQPRRVLPIGGGKARDHAVPSPVRDDQARRLLAATLPLSAGAKRSAVAQLAASRTQLGRIQRARKTATGPRATRLALREERVRTSISHESGELMRSEAAASARRGRRPSDADLARSSALLERQVRLPSALERAAGQRGRDYPALAGLVGLTAVGYGTLDAQRRRKARLEIDRELSARRSLGGVRDRPENRRPAEPRRGGARRDDDGHRHGGREHERGSGDGDLGRPERRESAVMRDARAVAEGRKRKLGIGNP